MKIKTTNAIIAIIVTIILLLSMIGGMFGCTTTPPVVHNQTITIPKNPNPPTTSVAVPVQAAATQTSIIADNVSKTADTIAGDANAIKTATTEPVVTSHADNIIAKTGDLKNDSAQLNKVETMLNSALDANAQQLKYTQALLDNNKILTDQVKILIEQNKTTSEQVEKYYKENEELKSKSRTLLNVLLSIIVAASVVGVGFAVYASITTVNKISALALGLGSVVIGVVSVTILTQWDKIAWIGLIGIAVILGLVVWQIISVIRGMHVKVVNATSALNEVVKTVDANHIASGTTTVPTLFKNIANSIQSPTTKSIVADIRN